MKLKDIAKRVGKGLIKDLVPGGAIIIDAINDALPSDRKLDKTTVTGEDLNNLPPALLERKFDVKETELIQGHTTLRVALEADAANPQSTRPRIAMGAFCVVALCNILVAAAWAYGVITGKPEMVKAANGGAQLVLFLSAPLVTILFAYFGVLAKEHKNRLDAAGGFSHAPGILGAIGNLVRRK